MPTGLAPFRRLYLPTPSSSTWTYSGFVGTATQIMYVPIYQVRNSPDVSMQNRCNALIAMFSAASRQRLASQGWEIECCALSPTDGAYQSSGRNNRAGLAETGALSQGLPGVVRTSHAGSNNTPDGWSDWWAVAAHEGYWIENGTYFPPGNRPAGHTNDVAISDWAEVATFQTQCNANGQPQTSGNLCNGMRTAQRGNNATFTTSAIPWNATTAQLLTALSSIGIVNPAHIQQTGAANGPLPGAIDIVFFGQYNQLPLAALTVVTNSLVGGGSPVVTRQRVGGPGADPIMRFTTTGTVTGGSFVLGFQSIIDDMTKFVGTGTSGTTPAQRVTQWVTNVCNNNGWAM